MKKIISFILCTLIIGTVVAQQPKYLQRINSTNFIVKGINYHDEGKYQEALAEYAKVPYGDTYYDLALYEKALSQEMMGDYRTAIQNINELLDNPSCKIARNKMFMVLGDCYDYLAQYDKAVEAYDQALIVAPYDYLTIFNKGVSLMNNEKYEEALECFKKSILISPAHQGSHYRYGLCCLQLGYTVPGILALNYSTLINTSSKYCLNALQLLDEIYDNGVSAFNNEHDIDISDEYEELNVFYKDIHQLLNSKAAETQKFHYLTKINHNIVKYNQLVLSNIKARPGSRAIEDMLYVPLFQQILEKKQYNTLCYYQLQETDVDNEKVAKKAQKMKKEFNVLIDDIVTVIQDQAALGLGVENPDGITYIYNDRLRLKNWGKLITLYDNLQVEEGQWTTIDENGQISEISNFTKGKANGLSQLYDAGELTQKAMAQDGKADGRIYLYTPDPIFHQEIPSEEFDIKNDEYEGNYRSYSKQGVLIQEGSLVKGKFEGPVVYYDEQGHLSSQENYVKGKYYGQQKSYYPVGQLKSSYRVGNEDEKTEYQDFYIDGAKRSEGFIRNDKRVGKWISYFPSGQISTVENYDDEGKNDGEGIQYHSNGNIDTRVSSNHGEYAKYETFGIFSKAPECTYLFNNGKLTNVTSYMPDGSVRKEYPVNGKSVSFDLYSELGYKKLNGTLDADFQWQGVRKLFAPNGQVIIEATYKNDQRNGEEKTYYMNGRLKNHSNHIEGKANGIMVEYFDNKENSISSETYYENDTIKGPFYQYFFDGNIIVKGRISETGEIIERCEYRPDRTKSLEIKYYHNIPCYIINYNRNNEVIARDTIVNGKGTLKYYYPEGQLKAVFPYQGGNIEGMAYFYNLHGQIIDSVNYLCGKNNSYERHIYPTGEKQSEVKCILGDFHGKYKYYTPDGIMTTESTFEYGELTHNNRYNILDGKLFYDINYTNGERTGKTSYYAPDGKTVLYEIMFNDDLPVSISCAQKGGKMSDPVLIGNEDQTFKAYYPNGAVGAVIPLRNGVFNGVKSIYYPNGQAFQTMSFTDDLTEGQAITYYPNGTVYHKCDYKEDQRHGEEVFYYPNGQVKYESHYYYDLPHGEFKTYDKDGKLTHKVIMYYGEPIVDDRY